MAVLIIAIVFSASLFIPLLWWWRSRRLGDLQEPLLECVSSVCPYNGQTWVESNPIGMHDRPIQYRLDAAMRYDARALTLDDE